MKRRPLRIAYAMEFFLAVVAFFECWSQVAGQAPLDLMPWWLKLLFATTFSYLAVKLTAALVNSEPFPALGLMRWGLAMVALVALIAITTYYYHLNVPPDEETDEPATASSVLSTNAAVR